MSAAPLFPLAPAVHISGEIPPRPAYPEFVGLPDLPALAAMKAIPQWVAWDYELRFYEAKRGSEPRPPTWSKVPLDPGADRRAKSSDPATWGTYERAAGRARAGKMPGVGFMLAAADGLGGYDLDRVRDQATGELASWAAELVALGEAYAETSPSGRGVRMFSLSKPASVQKCDPAQVEMYRDKRFLTVTGRHLDASPIDLRPAPRTEAALLERVVEFRKRIAAEREAQREAEGRPQPKPRRTGADGPKSFCAAVNEAAFADMAAWIPTLFSGYGSRTPGGGWRLTPADLDRDDQYEEDLSLDPKGFVDFAVADMGDEREGKRTPIDLVMEWGVLFAHFHEPLNAIEAAKWLCGQLDVTPDSLGWRPRSEADHFDAKAAAAADTPKGKAKKERRQAEQRGVNDVRPVITVRAGQIEENVDAMEAALIARGGFYQRAGAIVGIGEVPIVTAGEQEATALRVIPKGKHAIAEAISSAACMMRYDARSDEEVVINPPMALVETLMERTGRLRLPPLAGVITAPTLRPDGTVLDAPGYDKATGLFFEPGDQEFPSIAPRPSRADAEAALATLVEVVQHFPFVAPADRSVALSAIVTACVRQAIPTAPLHAFSAPVRGSGKSMLADVASVVATGRPAAVVAQHADDAEMEKRLTGMLLQGAQITAIDNCVTPVDGVFFNMITSQTVATVRPLGSSRMVDVPSNSFLMAGGNGLVISGDMTRRTVLCSLDPRMERPETRRFGFDPVARAKAERGQLVAAVLTLLLAHRAAGEPARGEPLGSFERWSRLVRDALVWLGCADPLLTMSSIQEDDPEKAELEAVLTKWSEKVGPERVTVAQLIDRVAAYDQAPFRMDLLAIAGTGGVINGRRLGKWLGRHAKRRSNGRWLEQGGLRGGNMTWHLRAE